MKNTDAMDTSAEPTTTMDRRSNHPPNSSSSSDLIINKEPFADIVRHYVLDLLEATDILQLRQLPECRESLNLDRQYCSIDGNKLEFREITLTPTERQETQHIFESNAQNARDANQAHKDHDLCHFMDDDNGREQVCPRCHACLGCQRVFRWQERQHLDPVYCEDCPGFWCDDCYFTDTLGPDHANCCRCDQEMCAVQQQRQRQQQKNNTDDTNSNLPICDARLCEDCTRQNPTCNTVNYTCGRCEKNFCHGCYGAWQNINHPDGAHHGFCCDDCIPLVEQNPLSHFEWYFSMGPERV
ncbi:expressed unknown protein [Seminavis robusta]|uniref:Uncharacterized protein n=1 Tax=Seminavis robusta TaxID=568900 RepID=A0A9N8F1A9_9STRA|nr:expressed unknown protein [Seminavis robusta]|eukprot:Sro2496_g329330.1 n/a (298) ;mRNA; r:8999-9892